ncbi:type VI secretion system-associated protein TagF [Pseudoduganella sp. FT93W]|uniref:Type VI secretion system-associated protein TagF n=1 Tax=Duganella fentianensis TaxID=2692177 RepID=A0A845HZX6_9BURK|nr:type VI secretion system-associated protein TagF [Duganella fentianensis]MYN45105.1 type VI secretion system-associated protein TagF [Duganella fentianensis]
MSSAEPGVQLARIAYFGKLPARADFIKAADHPAVLKLLDSWLAEVMNALSSDPRWKLHYDALLPLDFVFLGTRRRHAIAGQLRASGDRSQRRFPFLCASLIEVAQARSFLPLSPMLLAPLWQQLSPLASSVCAAHDPALPLQLLTAASVEIERSTERQEQCFAVFVEQQTIAALEAMLDSRQVRQLILALGLLLQPVRRSGAERLDKSLVLPLPQPPVHRMAVATFWLTLIMPFLLPADFELCLFIGQQRGRYVLVLGFGGAAPETLQAIIDPQCAAEQQISFEYTGWVDELITGDAEVQKLSAYLDQGQLSLRSVISLFQETFH